MDQTLPEETVIMNIPLDEPTKDVVPQASEPVVEQSTSNPQETVQPQIEANNNPIFTHNVEESLQVKKEEISTENIGNSCSNLVGHIGDRDTNQCIYCGTLMPNGFPYVDDEFTEKDIIIGKATSEKALEIYIYENIHDLWEKIFSEKVRLCIRQYGDLKFKSDSQYLHVGPRIDLFVQCESGNNYLVEIKNPKESSSQTMNAIGKLLYYSVTFPEANKMVLISTVYEKYWKQTKDKYNLPIDFVFFGKDKILLLKD